MNDIQQFAAYAARFEEVYVSDNWELLEPFFDKEATYLMMGKETPYQGRAAVFAGLKESLDQNDRRFETRKLELLEGPELRNGAVWLSWRATYTQENLPPLVMEGVETVRFKDGRIIEMVDTLSDEMIAQIGGWMNRHSDQLPAA